MTEVAFSTSVTSLATAIAGLRNGLEGPSAVDVHRNARGKYARRGVHYSRGRGSGRACEQRRENGVHGGAKCVIGKGAD
jgi:hypothetical protein